MNAFHQEKWPDFQKMIAPYPTPLLTINLPKIRSQYLLLKELLPHTSIFYAIKANPHIKILTLLKSLGSCFDIASIYELNLLLSLHIDPQKISYGNTIKKRKDIAIAYEKGVRMFATDSGADLKNIAEYAPSSKIFFRVASNGIGADWPLSKKFGCHYDKVPELAFLAKKLNLEPYGIIFHVGSQQRNIKQWTKEIEKCRSLFTRLEKNNIFLKCINLGGGFPASYYKSTPPIQLYAKEIRDTLKTNFNENMPKIFVEPGRFLVADAGILVSEIILIDQKSDSKRWIYLDVGIFNGLIETMNEHIKYPIVEEKKGVCSPCILAGPTCDSMDVLYEKFQYKLSNDLMIGDKVYFLTTGAYTQSYSSVSFNGFPPIKTICYNL